MIRIDDTLLEEIGLISLPKADRDQMLRQIYETLEMRVGMRLAERMSDQQLDEFERFIDTNDEAGALKWLESNFPDYKQVVADELDKLKAEIKKDSSQILAAMQAQSGQQAAPQVQQGQQPAAPAPQQFGQAAQQQPQFGAPAPQSQQFGQATPQPQFPSEPATPQPMPQQQPAQTQPFQPMPNTPVPQNDFGQQQAQPQNTAQNDDQQGSDTPAEQSGIIPPPPQFGS